MSATATEHRNRSYCFNADGQKFFVVRRRLRELFPASEAKGNPMVWFSWTVVDGNKEWLAVAVKTMREAQAPVDDIALYHRAMNPVAAPK